MAVVEHTFRAMASHVQVISVDGPSGAGAAVERMIRQLEAAWSRFDATSDVTRLNDSAGRPVPVDPVTVTLLETMTEAWQMTGGLYDPTVLPALIMSGYTHSIDDADAVTTISVGYVGLDEPNRTVCDISIDPKRRTATLPVGMSIDAGGIGKGLAADLVVAELLARGAAGALVSIGGDIAAAGEPPDDRGWTVQIEDHLDRSRSLGRVLFSGGGFATSSTRSRRWTQAGAEMHHMIDPAVSGPSESDIVAASVIGRCGWQAEAHATALVLGGTARFMNHAQRHAVEAVATTSAGERLATAGIAEHLKEKVIS